MKKKKTTIIVISILLVICLAAVFIVIEKLQDDNPNPAERTEPIDPISSTDHEPLEIEGEPEETYRESAVGDQEPANSKTPSQGNSDSSETSEKPNVQNESKPSTPSEPSTPEKPSIPSEPSEPEKPSHTHSYGSWKVIKSPTCTSDGKEERTCSCGKSETRSVKALGHNWEKKTKEVTVEKEEYHQACNYCGFDYGIRPTPEELKKHALYDENGDKRTVEEFALHSRYGDKLFTITTTEEVTYYVCSRCKAEKN